MKRSSFFRTSLLTALVPALILMCETEASAQKLRGPTAMAGSQLLILRPQVGLMNNGSLQTTQNPNANLPNQSKFIYIAAMPLGDRLGRNGVYYDTDLLPNLGLFQGGQNLFGQANQNNNNINNPIQPPQQPVQAAFMARQPMMAMYGYYTQIYMQQAMVAAMMMQPNSNPTGFGWFVPTIPAAGDNVAAGRFGGFAAPMSNADFASGFRKTDDGGF